MDKEIMHQVRLESKEGNPILQHFISAKCSVSMLKVIEDCIPPEVFKEIREKIAKKKAEFEGEKTPENIVNTSIDLGLRYALFSGCKPL